MLWFHCGFNFHFPKTNVQHLFMLNYYPYIFFGELSFKYLAHFKKLVCFLINEF